MVVIFLTESPMLTALHCKSTLADEALAIGPQARAPCKYWPKEGDYFAWERERGDKKDEPGNPTLPFLQTTKAE